MTEAMIVFYIDIRDVKAIIIWHLQSYLEVFSREWCSADYHRPIFISLYSLQQLPRKSWGESSKHVDKPTIRHWGYTGDDCLEAFETERPQFNWAGDKVTA